MIELILYSPYTALIYLLICIGVALHGRSRKITAVGAFLISVLFTPLVGILFTTASAQVEPKTKGWTSPLQKR